MFVRNEFLRLCPRHPGLTRQTIKVLNGPPGPIKLRQLHTFYVTVIYTVLVCFSGGGGVMWHVLSTNQRPLSAAHHGRVIPRTVRTVLRLRRSFASHMLRQGFETLLSTRL